MIFPNLVFITKISDLTAEIWKSNWSTLIQWWNDHDQGVRPWTNINTTGSLTVGARSTASSVTLAITDQTILVDSTSAIRTITLPTAVSISGRIYIVKDWKGQASTHNITIATTSAQTIDGAATVVMSTNFQTVRVISDGSNWSVI
jgi:hypothetical protein